MRRLETGGLRVTQARSPLGAPSSLCLETPRDDLSPTQASLSVPGPHRLTQRTGCALLASCPYVSRSTVYMNLRTLGWARRKRGRGRSLRGQADGWPLALLTAPRPAHGPAEKARSECRLLALPCEPQGTGCREWGSGLEERDH